MPSFELTGRVKEIFPTRQVTDKFSSREFIVELTETNGNYENTEQYKVQCSNAKIDLLNNVSIEDEVKISFNLKGRRWEKDGKVSYFTSLECWKLEVLGKSKTELKPEPKVEEMPTFDSGNDDSLPF